MGESLFSSSKDVNPLGPFVIPDFTDGIQTKTGTNADSLSPLVELSSTSVPLLKIPWRITRLQKRVNPSIFGPSFSEEDFLRIVMAEFSRDFGRKFIDVVQSEPAAISNRWIVVSSGPITYRKGINFYDDIRVDVGFAVINPDANLPLKCSFSGIKNGRVAFGQFEKWSLGSFFASGRLQWNKSVVSGYRFPSATFNQHPRLVQWSHSGLIQLPDQLLLLGSFVRSVEDFGSQLFLDQMRRSYADVIADIVRNLLWLAFRADSASVVNTVAVFALSDLTWLGQPRSTSNIGTTETVIYGLVPAAISPIIASSLVPPGDPWAKLSAMRIVAPEISSPVVGLGRHTPVDDNVIPEFNLLNTGVYRRGDDGFSSIRPTGTVPPCRPIKVTRKAILDTLGEADD